MFPLTCPDGTEHNFEISASSATNMCCTHCKVDYDEFTKVSLKKDEIKKHIIDIAGYFNGGDPELIAEAMMEAMHITHRTIQQNFLRGLVAFIGKMKDMPVDLRNQACVEWCKRVSEIEAFFPRI